MYKSISLPYNYDSLEPFLDKETINIHYNIIPQKMQVY